MLNIEPRLGAKWNVNDNFRLKIAAGRYSQNLVAANSDRDVVNLFYGFLSSTENIPSTVTAPNGNVREVKDPLQRANHYVAGFELDLTNEITVNIEGYLKDFRQVTNINRNKIYEDTQEFEDEPEELRKDFIVETGVAYGGDFQLKYEKGPSMIWAVYSYTYVDRFDGIDPIQSDLGPSAQREPGGQPFVRTLRFLARERALELRIGLPLHPDPRLLRQPHLRGRHRYGLHHIERRPEHDLRRPEPRAPAHLSPP